MILNPGAHYIHRQRSTILKSYWNRKSKSLQKPERKKQSALFSPIKEGCNIKKNFECHMGWDLQKVGKCILQRTYFWSCCRESLCSQILLWGKLTPCREGGLAHLELRINTWQENKPHQGSVSGLGMSVLQRLTHMLSFLHMNVPTLIHRRKHMRVHRIRTSAPCFSRSHGSFSDCKRAGRVLSKVNWTASAAGQRVLKPAHSQKYDWSIQLTAMRFHQQRCPW